MAAVGKVAGGGEIAVGEQHRRLTFVGLDPRGVDRHDVGPVREIGDAAEAFRLALGAIGVAGAVEAHELGVGGRVDDGLDREREGPVRRLRDGETIGRRHVAVAVERLAVDRQGDEAELVAVEHHRRRCACLRIGLELEPRAHAGGGGIERDVELDHLHQPVGRSIILEADGAGLLGAHRLPFFFRWAALVPPI
jgi:hypothetical protein